MSAPIAIDVETVLSQTSAQLSTRSVLKALQHLFALQEARASVYHELERGFATFLADKYAPTYQVLLMRTRNEFAQISQHIRSVEELLRELDHGSVADEIRQLQLFEKDKLLQMQAYQSSRVEKEVQRILPKGEVDYVHEHQVKLMKQERAAIIEQVNEQLQVLRYELFELEEAVESDDQVPA
mmetsp:Transcript_14709/g.37433  ORF Transcript_14709/g.37433 Transcript_14709/m.37433 type:complete len:183 (+) Transcript_14709:123-671(+)|eukprot:CAMPEP_0177652622 /NCGR_PEP_ID=MMETSP0447-20121125/13238_1 /TAXON_ID=0 /ORGANISM="Stygamoeba regulata, Strain BSH-02190019" /LENGTH=182 /DNA_ID=CAMNT_0019155899 /DNA_START=106 /DNA_END=654 /DNA_ORIENTATION=-